MSREFPVSGALAESLKLRTAVVQGVFIQNDLGENISADASVQEDTPGVARIVITLRKKGEGVLVVPPNKLFELK